MEQIFTVETANRALVLVSPILRDIVEKFSALQKIKAIDASETATGTHIADEITHHLKELSDIGIILQDPVRGIADFPCLHNDEIVMLCWTYGEPHVAHWHKDTETFQNRKPIDESFLISMRV